MNTSMINFSLAALLAVATCVPTLAFAQDVAKTEEAAPVKRRFDAHVMLREWEGGACTVQLPGQTTTIAARNYKAYPYGTRITLTNDGDNKARSLKLYFSSSDYVQLVGEGSVTLVNEPGTYRAGIVLNRGTLQVTLDPSIPQDLFYVNTASGNFTSIAGGAKIVVSPTMSKSKERTPAVNLSVELSNGEAKFQGQNFFIPKMIIGQGFTCATYADNTETHLEGGSSDFLVNLDNGSDTPTKFAFGAGGLVKFSRRKAKSGRWVVSVLTISGGGTAKNFFSYVDGNPAIRTGELIGEVLPEEDAVAEEKIDAADEKLEELVGDDGDLAL